MIAKRFILSSLCWANQFVQGKWLKQFWTPTRDSYTGHRRLIVDSDLRKAYDTHHPQLPEFVAAAIKIFAERELS